MTRTKVKRHLRRIKKKRKKVTVVRKHRRRIKRKSFGMTPPRQLRSDSKKDRLLFDKLLKEKKSLTIYRAGQKVGYTDYTRKRELNKELDKLMKKAAQKRENRGAITQSEHKWLLKQVKKEPPKDPLLFLRLRGRIMKLANIGTKEGDSEVFITRKNIPDFQLQNLQALTMPGTKLQRLPYTRSLDFLISSKSEFRGFPGHIEFTKKFKT